MCDDIKYPGAAASLAGWGWAASNDCFFCVGRNKRRDCDQPYVSVAAVEETVVDFYKSVRIPEKVQKEIREGLHAELEYQRSRAAPEVAHARRELE